MSHLLYQTVCPRCKENGKDKSGDNLAVYNDNHKYCFSCGYYCGVTGLSSFNPKPILEHKVSLPEDCSTNYPTKAIKWMTQYGLGREALLKHNVLWSEEGMKVKGQEARELLLFPVWNQSLQAFQARYFGGLEGIPKWIGRGKLSDIYNILSGKEPLVLTEDIVSAIKVNMVGHAAMPVYGSNIKNRFAELYRRGHKQVVIWLDPDMHSKVIKDCGCAKGLDTKIIFSDKDPKEHTFKEIKEYIK